MYEKFHPLRTVLRRCNYFILNGIAEGRLPAKARVFIPVGKLGVCIPVRNTLDLLSKDESLTPERFDHDLDIFMWMAGGVGRAIDANRIAGDRDAELALMSFAVHYWNRVGVNLEALA